MLYHRLLPPSGLIASNPATVVFTTSAVLGTDTSAYTFSGLSFGSTAARRKLLFMVSGGSGSSERTVTEVSAANSTATFVARQQDLGESIEAWDINLPGGTSGDVKVLWNTARDRCGVAVYTIHGASSTAYDTGGNADNPMTTTIDIPAGGVGVAAACTESAGNRTHAWVGLNEDYDETVESAGITHSGASAAFSTERTGLEVRATPNGTDTGTALLVVSYGSS